MNQEGIDACPYRPCYRTLCFSCTHPKLSKHDVFPSSMFAAFQFAVLDIFSFFLFFHFYFLFAFFLFHIFLFSLPPQSWYSIIILLQQKHTHKK